VQGVEMLYLLTYLLTYLLKPGYNWQYRQQPDAVNFQLEARCCRWSRVRLLVPCSRSNEAVLGSDSQSPWNNWVWLHNTIVVVALRSSVPRQYWSANWRLQRCWRERPIHVHQPQLRTARRTYMWCTSSRNRIHCSSIAAR